MVVCSVCIVICSLSHNILSVNIMPFTFNAHKNHHQGYLPLPPQSCHCF